MSKTEPILEELKVRTRVAEIPNLLSPVDKLPQFSEHRGLEKPGDITGTAKDNCKYKQNQMYYSIHLVVLKFDLDFNNRSAVERRNKQRETVLSALYSIVYR